ncbi:MAG: hypothetical protein IKN59_01135 [Paludibacteraceae bacterium]|nr:hypothetical protein [Paludibacteraceae bacterium]
MGRQDNLHPVKAIHGAMEKDGSVNRMKTYRDPQGHIIAYGPQEIYKPNKRDYRKHPATDNELRHQNLMTEAARLAKIEREDPVKCAVWQQRFLEQLDHATNDTPAGLVNGKRKIYKKFDNFVVAVMYNNLKQQHAHP